MITLTITADHPFDLMSQVRYLNDMLTGGAGEAPMYDPQEIPEHRPVAPVRAPVATPEATEVHVLDKHPSETKEVFEVDVPEALGAKDAVALKLKTMATLQQAFADGKVRKLRELLTEFGDGAKSFPEVDMKAFPAIAEAIQNGALN